MARLGRMRMGKAKAKASPLANILNRLSALSSGKFGEAFAGAEAGFGASGKMGQAAANVLAVSTTLVGFGKAVSENTQRLQAHNQTLAEVSGQMAAVMAVREQRELIRTMRRGDETAASAKFLTDAEQARKDATKEIAALGDKLSNYLEGFLERVVTVLASPINDIASLINRAIGDAEDRKDIPVTLGEWLGSIDQAAMTVERERLNQEARRKGGIR